MLPPYVYDLIAAVQQYEDEHPTDGIRFCFDSQLCGVPKEELDRAAAIAHYKQETARRQDEQRRDENAAHELSAPQPPVRHRWSCSLGCEVLHDSPHERCC